MTANEWNDRAAAYRTSDHNFGADLDTVIEWCEPAAGVRALDVATGGGHVAKRLAAAGCEVTTCDAAAGMEPDVVCPAEELAFADASFDVVVCRLAGHHFDDLQVALKEMARVSRRLVVLEDTLYSDERVEQAEKLRDATHVRAYSEAEWRAFIAAAGLQTVKAAFCEKRHQMGEWLALTGCSGDTAERVRGLLVHRRVSGGAWTDTKVLFKCRKRQAP